MGKLWSATSLVALTLLGCLTGTEVEAQYFWPNSAQVPKASPLQPRLNSMDQWGPPQYPQSQATYIASSQIANPHPYPAAQQQGMPQNPQWPPNPPPPKIPISPQWPPNPAPPKIPTSPQWPLKPQPPKIHVPPQWPPKVPPYHHWSPKVSPSPQVPQYPTPHPPKIPTPPWPPRIPTPPQAPKIPTPPQPPMNPTPPWPPKMPAHPWPPKTPTHPWPPKMPTPPWPPKTPTHPWPPKIPTPPQQPPVRTTLPPVIPPHLPQQPQHPTLPYITATYPPIPTTQPIQSCDVAQGQRVPCGLSGITAAACKAISCCFDGHQCYYGKAVTVQCTKDAQFIVVIAKDATLPNIDLQSISLLGDGHGCTNVDSNSKFAIYQFPVTTCGTTVTEQPGLIIYENRMSSSYEVGAGPLGAITRDSFYELLFQCRYIGSSVETVVAEVLPLHDPPLPVAALGPLTVQLRIANGHCQTKGCNEVDVAYRSYYRASDYPVTKVLRDPVYVEVYLTGKTDPNLVLTLGHCWTTTSPTPHSLPQWDILVDGCPYKDDRYMSSLVAVGPSSGVDFPTHYRRFIFRMFTFVDSTSLVPQKENVYIHCSTTVCKAAPGSSCEPVCTRKKRAVKAADQQNAEPRFVASVGPVVMGAPEQQTAQKVILKNLVENIW